MEAGMILGLSGMKGSGKDTVAAYLVKEHGFERKAFADPLKKSVAALLGIPFSDIDRLKNDEGAVIALASHYGNLSPVTFREFLQRYGTEAHRDVFGEDFWIDYTLPVQGFYPGRAIVVSDVRFVNEAARVKELGGYNVRIIRPTVPILDMHISEVQEFDYDFQIINDGDLGELAIAVEEVLTLAGHHIRVE
jgi:hypothetical protein